MSLDKYKWRLRILLVETPDYKNEKYKEAKKLYQDNIKEFHRRFVKFITKRDKPFKIKLIGFDGKVKKTYHKLEPKKVFRDIDDMPMGKVMKKMKPTNLSLYSNYKPKTTIHGLGFKDKETAVYTLEKIKNKSMRYQKSVVNTMLGRAKTHPHQTKGMCDAIKVYQDWLKKH